MRRLDPLRGLRDTFSRLSPYTRPHRKSLMAAAVTSLLLVVTELARPWPIKIVIDQVILGQTWDALPGFLAGEEHRTALLLVACAAVLLLAGLAGLLSYATTVILARAGHEVVAGVRRDLHRRLMRLPLSFHDQARKGDLLVRLTGDASAMSTLLVEGIFSLGQETLMLTGVLLITLCLDLQLTLIAALTIPAVLFIVRRYGTRIRQAVRQQRRREGEIGIAANSSLAGVEVVQAFGLERHVGRQFRRDSKRSQRAGVRAARLEGSMGRWVELAIAAGTALLLWLGSRRVLAGQLTAGELIVLISYVRALYKPLRKLATRSTKIAKSAASAERILEILDCEDELPQSEVARPLPRAEGSLGFEGVSYAYRPGEPVLRDVNLEIGAGEHVALVGVNGAGKSTLVSLIARLRDPDAGVVRLDGHDVRELDLADLRRHVALVFQDTVLFDGTLAENVWLGDPDAPHERFLEAVKASGLEALARSLPQGLDTPVGEEGLALSGGQRQRVALARALLRDARVLVLDEPSRSLDPAAAARFHSELLPSLAGRTVLVITHELVTTQAVARVIRLVGGRVASGAGQAFALVPGTSTS